MSIVFISEDDPVDSSVVSGVLVLDIVHLLVVRVDGGDQKVVGNVLQVSLIEKFVKVWGQIFVCFCLFMEIKNKSIQILPNT